jgi:metalloendopeptidase OMA1, mitochondrial
MFSRISWRAKIASRNPTPLVFPQSIPRFVPKIYAPRNVRQAHRRIGGNPRESYRTSKIQYVAYLWRTSQVFRAGVAGIGTTGVMFYVLNLETVPGSGRRRFNWVSPELEKSLAETAQMQVLQQYKHQILPEWAPETKMVQRVLDKLIPNSGVGEDGHWEVRVIDDEQPNAFVVPG